MTLPTRATPAPTGPSTLPSRPSAIGLNDGLKGEFNGVKAVNREEACLYAFNTLNATMVEYTNQTIVIANGTVKTDKVAKDMEQQCPYRDHQGRQQDAVRREVLHQPGEGAHH